MGYPEEGDVQNCVHTLYEGRTGYGEGVGPYWAVGWVVAVVAVEGSLLDAGEDEEEEDSETHADSCARTGQRKILVTTEERGTLTASD